MQGALHNGVSTVVVPAYDVASWDQVCQLTALPGVYGALGLHPWQAQQQLDMEKLESLLSAKRMVAVGEIGLDFAADILGATAGCCKKRQLEIFTAQLELAQRLELPVLLHCRGGFEEMLAVLKDHAPVVGVIHAFSRGPELAQRFVDVGCHIAFGGALTRSNAKRARRAALSLQRDAIVLETDAPAIGMQGLEPDQVEPRHIPRVASALAQLRGESVEQVAGYTTDNAKRVLGLD